jgi:hypothetical protein
MYTLAHWIAARISKSIIRKTRDTCDYKRKYLFSYYEICSDTWSTVIEDK